MAAALERSGESMNSSDNMPSDRKIEYFANDDVDDEVSAYIKKNDSKMQAITIDIKMPRAAITIINDLQGMQQGLFKLIIGENGSKFEGQVFVPMDKRGSSTEGQVRFTFDANTSLLGDYFNLHTNRWEPFLVDAWNIKASVSRKYSNIKTAQMQTNLDVQMSSCLISFSEQLLISVGATSRMWSTYTKAEERTIEIMKDINKSDDTSLISLWKSSASSTARSLLVSAKYGVENNSGLSAYFELKSRSVLEQDGVRHSCPSGTVQYFGFIPPRGNGLGGKRAYGQDSKALKTIQLTIKGKIIKLQDLDEEINRPSRLVDLGFGHRIVIDVANKGKATIVHIRSQVHIHNHTSLPIGVSVKTGSGSEHIGTCLGIGQHDELVHSGSLRSSVKPLSSLLEKNAKSSKSSSSVGVPVSYLSNSNTKEKDSSQDEPFVTLELFPSYPGRDGNIITCCSFPIPSLSTLKEQANSCDQIKTYDVTCYTQGHSEEMDTSDDHLTGESITLQVGCKISLLGSKDNPFVELFLKPRALLQNLFPLSLSVLTAMPIGVRGHLEGDIKEAGDANMCNLLPDEIIEVYATDPCLSFSVKCGDIPSAGNETGWAVVQSDSLLLCQGNSLQKPLLCNFPSGDESTGIDFYIAEIASDSDKPDLVQNSQSESLESKKAPQNVSDDEKLDNEKGSTTSANDVSVQSGACRTFYIAAFNTAIDHTGEIFLEQCKKLKKKQSPLERPSYFNIFSSAHRDYHTMILPRSDTPIRAHKAVGKTDGKATKSMPFLVDDVTLSQGTSDFSVLLFEDKSPSGYFMYKELHPKGRYELHIVHEYLIYNGDGKNSIVVNQSSGSKFTLEPGCVHPLHTTTVENNDAMMLSFQFTDVCAMTDTIHVGSVGMKICEIRSQASGSVVGKFDIETVIGKKCARIVIRLGGVQFKNDLRTQDQEVVTSGLFANDDLHFQIDLLRTEVTIYDTGIKKEIMTTNLNSNDLVDERSSYSRVAQVAMKEFSVKYDRSYEAKDSEIAHSLLAASLQSIHVNDLTFGTKYPDVMKLSSQESPIFTLNIQSCRSNEAFLFIKNCDFKFASIEGKAVPIVFKTSEKFIWTLLDVANRTVTATAELAGVDASLEWDKKTGEYIIVVKDASNTSSQKDISDKHEELIPPQSQVMYDVEKVDISPLSLIVSFKRQPNASRYKTKKDETLVGETIHYFSTQLQFTIEEAKLSFKGYRARNIRGPAGQITDMITAAYASQLKFKIVTLLSAVSLQDWKYLTGRQDHGDEYIEGDILRLTGNMTGKSAGFVLKTTGKGVGYGIEKLVSAVGGGIQSTTELFGVGAVSAVGAGVNSILSGVGGGVGSTIEGVGVGAGKLVSGVGKGIGDAVGGVGGGVMLVAKGKVGEGAKSAAQGVSQGAETVVYGAIEGVGAVGSGLFTGIKNICGGCKEACQSCTIS
uniref:Uncharacterized protein n=1 Tax=Ditylum brightwellii TaxID=49249 RepID=A0A6V2F3X9_9STRA